MPLITAGSAYHLRCNCSHLHDLPNVMLPLRRLAATVPALAISLLGSCGYTSSEGVTWGPGSPSSSSTSYSSTISDDSGYSFTLVETGAESRFRIEGNLRPTLDLRGIAWIETGGKLTVQQEESGVMRAVHLQPNGKGAPLLTYTENGQVATFEIDDQNWYAARLEDLFSHSDIGSREYAQAVLEAEGIHGLIARAASMENTGLIEACLGAALASPDVTEDLCVQLAGAIMDVDHESSRADLMDNLAHRHPDSNALTSILIDSLSDLSSGSSRQDAILAFSKRDLNESQALALVDATKEFDYDSTRKETLIELAKLRTLEGDWTRKLLEAAEELDYSSSYQVVLEAFANGTVATPEDWVQLVKATENIDYDSNRSRTLQYFISRIPNDDAPLLAVVRAIDSIDTSSDQKDIVASLSTREAMSPSVWIALVNSCDDIDYDSTRRDALIQIIDNAPPSLPIHLAVLKSAKSIDTSSQLTDVLIALASLSKTEPGLGQAIAKATQEIDYESNAADVLIAVIKNAPSEVIPRDAQLIACARSTQSLSTSNLQANVLNAILDDPTLSQKVLKEVAKSLPHVDNESTRAGVQARLLDLLID
jgi:hypothetical protein